MKDDHTSRDYSLDLLRSLAIFGTVFLHALHEVFARTDYVGGVTWWGVNIFNAFSKSAIPLFIMISGALLFGKLTTVPGAWSRARGRLAIPLLFWAVFYRLVDYVWFRKPLDPAGFVHLFLNGNVFIFYFLVILLGIYVVHPIVRAYVAQLVSPNRVWWQIALICLSIGFVYSLASYLFDAEGKWWSAVTMWLPYYGYFIAGHLLYEAVHQQTYRSAALRRFLLLTIFCWLALALGNYLNLQLSKEGIFVLWHSHGQGVQYFDEYLTPLATGLAAGLFVLAARYGTNLLTKLKLKTVVASISQLSFGIYAIHAFVLQVIEHKLHFTTVGVSQALWLFAIEKLLLTLVASWGLSWVLARIPYLAKLTGVGSPSQSVTAGKLS